MNLTSGCITVASLVVCAVFGQTAPGPPAFEVASVKPAERPGPIRRHSPGRIRYEGIEFPELIRKAFGLPQYKVIWPDWIAGVARDHPPKEKLDPRYFTIEATLPPETTVAEFQLMFQNLLVDRFGLALHRATRQLAQYELSFAEGGPKMAKAKPVPDGAPPGLPDDNEDLARIRHMSTQTLSFGEEFGMRVRGDYAVAGIAELFSNYLQHPLVDRTGSTECRVGGGALARWPPSAAQTVRAVFPHTAFTKTRASEVQSKGSTESSSPARTRHTAWFPATVASHRSATA